MSFRPKALDPTIMGEAIEASRRQGRRWIHNRETRAAYRRMVGTSGWAIAQALANNATTPLHTKDARRCYAAGCEALGL